MMKPIHHTKLVGARHFALSRRRFLLSAAAILSSGGLAEAAEPSIVGPLKLRRPAKPVPDLFEEVVPKNGLPMGVAFEDALQKLIVAGVIDPDKYRASGKELPTWVERLLHGPSNDPIVFDRSSAPYLVDLLWPIGLANRVPFNTLSPINSLSIPTYASTGGWNLGRQPNGYRYFNQVDAVRLTPPQQTMVLTAAMNSYRPCCNNSTFFQDCNHGSALLGLFELAASQGATLDGLYGLALTANAYWFPDNYAKTALYFSYFYRKSWHDVEPKRVLSATFSSASGWQRNVNYPLLRANINLPGRSNGQQGC